jgi:hypothetical protein
MGDIKSISQIIESISPYYKKKGEPEGIHTIGYDSSTETLEPLYFYVVDLMTTVGLKPEKLIDNFSSTPGSGHFAELGQRATIMQQQASKLMGDVNTVLRSVLNIVYDLKEFKIRLQHYAGLKSKKKEEQEAATLSLKQIWMDKVDFAKGNSSIKAMAFGQAGFQTLIDAFLMVKDEKLRGPDGKEIDLNDRVKRILKPRIQEFNVWTKESEKELRKRYELEKTYLKSQVNSLKLYSRWARPYLKAASELETKDMGREPSLVKTFNTIILELAIIGKKELNVKDEAIRGTLPESFSKESFLKKLKRKYYSCILVDFNFRGIPQKAGQQAHYVFGGKAEITFRSYALNEDELKKLDEELDKSDLSSVLDLVEGTTTESLGQLQGEIDSFLEEKPEAEAKKMTLKDMFEPFAALFGAYNEKSESVSKPKAGEKKKGPIVVEKDSFIEENQFRKVAGAKAEDQSFDLFDIYKKAHSMESFT